MKACAGPTYAIVVRPTTNTVGFSRVAGSIARFLLRHASVATVEGLGDILQHSFGLKLTISRRISCEFIVGNVLNQGIIPTTVPKIK